MKITFVIGGNVEVYSLEGIKETDEWAYESSTYYLIKALEKNENFINAVRDARVKLKIPEEGYDQSWYENIYFDIYSNTDLESIRGKKKLNDFETWFKKVEREAEKIYKQLKLHTTLHSVLPYIIIGNFVYPTGVSVSSITNTSLKHTGTPPFALHIIIQNNISKNELIKFIEDNWVKLSKDIKELPDRPEAYISSRDMMIVELRDYEKLSFNDIADRVIETFKINNAEGKINEDSIKSAYHRAKTKIAYLGRKKT